jgi:hypothetical protein
MLVAFSLPAVAAAQQTINYVSDTSWAVTDVSSVPVGNSVFVCLNAGSPSPCPAGAVLWGYDGSGWGQSLASIPGAGWIWAPGLTGSSESALAKYTFTRTFTLDGPPVSGSLFMTADDYVEARVNGTFIGSVGSIVNAGSSGAGLALVSFDILPNLAEGENTIEITGQNGPVSFGGSTYQTNPAGVVFGGTIVAAAPVPIVAAVPVPTMGAWTTLLLGIALAGLAIRHLRRQSLRSA